LEDPY